MQSRTGKSVFPLIIGLALIAYAAGFRLPLPDGLIPTPADAPIKAEGLHVMIVEETADRRSLPPSQVAIFTSTKVRKWLDENAEDWRIVDASANDIEHEAPKWQEAMRRERPELPWLIISDHPNGGTEKPLPDTVEQTIRELEEWK